MNLYSAHKHSPYRYYGTCSFIVPRKFTGTVHMNHRTGQEFEEKSPQTEVTSAVYDKFSYQT